MAPDQGLLDCKQSGVKDKKIRLTYAFTLNADGSNKLAPFVIGKAACSQAFKKKTDKKSFYFRMTSSAISCHQTFRASKLRTLSQISQHISNQKIKASSNASKPTIMLDSFNKQSIIMIKA